MALLKRGDYKQGWVEFAKRWRPQDYAAIAVDGVPEWHGEPLDGRSVLLVGDQGFGDQLQFLRFARVLEELGATVDVCVREPLVPLAERVPGVHRAWSGKAERALRLLGAADERAVMRWHRDRDDSR